jgi:O-antigen ligase
MESINDKEDGTRIERFHTWEIGWEMFKDKPIFGVGAGSFANTSHLYEAKTSWYTGHEKSLSGRAAHSLYFQVIPELGIIGICIFAYILFYLPLSLIGRARSLSYENKEERLKKIYLNILITSMAGYVIAGAFISVAYYPHMPMWLIMFSIYKYMDRNTENLLTSKEK